MQGVATVTSDSALEEAIERNYWEPEYSYLQENVILIELKSLGFILKALLSLIALFLAPTYAQVAFNLLENPESLRQGYAKAPHLSLLTLFILVAVALIACDRWIGVKTSPYIFEDIDKLPAKK